MKTKRIYIKMLEFKIKQDEHVNKLKLNRLANTYKLFKILMEL